MTFEWAESWEKHVLLRFFDLLFKRKTNPSRYQIQLCIWAN